MSFLRERIFYVIGIWHDLAPIELQVVSIVLRQYKICYPKKLFTYFSVE